MQARQFIFANMKSLFLKNLHQHYRIAVAVSFALLLLVIVFLFIFGKTGSFILINGYYNRPLDYFFQFATFLGDGLIYIPIVLYSIIFNRKFFIPVIAGIVFCTLLAQGLKRFA